MAIWLLEKLGKERQQGMMLTHHQLMYCQVKENMSTNIMSSTYLNGVQQVKENRMSTNIISSTYFKDTEHFKALTL